jgi:methionine-rich copper-binding protein CopC
MGCAAMVHKQALMGTSRFARLAAVLVAAWAVSAPVAARAHALILSSEPAAGAVVHGASVAVLLRFNSRIDQERSRLVLVRTDGSETVVSLGDAATPDKLAATLAGLAPGDYRLRWQVLAIDGHITRGDIPFTVAP